MLNGNQGGMGSTKRKRLGVRTPAEIFKCCPYCDGHDLLAFDGQSFCGGCGWNSIATFVEAQSLARHGSEEMRNA